MSAVAEITTAAFLQGSHRPKIILPKQTNCCLLWGTLRRQSCPSIRISRPWAEIPVKVVSKDVATKTCMAVPVQHLYRIPLVQESAEAEQLLTSIQTQVSDQIIGLKTEQCFNIGVDGNKLSSEKLDVLTMILGEPESKIGTESFLDQELKKCTNAVIIEVGPRLSPFTATAWSANTMSIFRSCGLTEINRIELSRRYLLNFSPRRGLLFDRQNIVSKCAGLLYDRMTECIYSSKLTSFEVVPEEVPVMEKGQEALEEINENMGLGFDEQDLHCYTMLFKDDIRRNPTNVELIDIALSNSEHKRRGHLVEKSTSQIVGSLYNSEGGSLNAPLDDPIFNNPENMGQIVMDTIIDSTSYLYRNKHWNLETRRSVEGEMRKLLKKIIFSGGGIGQIDHVDGIEKGDHMLVVRIGGPTDRIGMGGGISGKDIVDLDFNAVQHGESEMAQKLHRVVRACVEMEESNPIISLRDLKAGGNICSNVVKEKIYPKGFTILTKEISVGGSTTMSVLEIWGTENQEQDAILVKPDGRDLLQSICATESLPMAVIGSISCEGRIILVDAFSSPTPMAPDLEKKVHGEDI